MSKIKQFDRTTAKNLRAPIEDALKKLGTEYGISIKLGSGRFTAESLTFKLELATIDKTGVVLTREAQDFKLFAEVYNLKPEDLGKSFVDFDGRTYTVTGLKSRSDKYPITVKRDDGKGFKFPATRVARQLSVLT